MIQSLVLLRSDDSLASYKPSEMAAAPQIAQWLNLAIPGFTCLYLAVPGCTWLYTFWGHFLNTFLKHFLRTLFVHFFGPLNTERYFFVCTWVYLAVPDWMDGPLNASLLRAPLCGANKSTALRC